IKIREDLSPPEASIYLKPSRPTMEYLKSEFITLDGSQTIDANTGEQLNFTWSTNLSGGIILGYGEELELKMDEGHHNITLLVVDSDGLEGISWVHITVLNTAPRALISTPGMKFRAGEPTVNVSEKASFSATLSSDQDMDELVFFWDFGDSTTEVGENVTKSWNFFGPFNVTLTVDDGSVQRSEDEIEFTIYVNSIPEVSVDTGVQVEIDERFTISANGSRDQDGDELDYLWDFDGDGVWDASGFNATWKYAVEDDHEVTLRASDGFAWDDIKTIVSVVYPNDRPVARLANELIDGEVIVSLDDNKGDVELDASPSIDPDDDVNGNDEIDGDEESNLTYTWDVDPEEDSDGDGIDNNDADEEGRKVNVEMKKSGTMKIILNVSDPRGLYDTLEIKLRGNNPPGSLSIHVGPSSRVLVGAQVTLTGSARDPDRSDSNKLEYHWSYGDGKNSTNPSFQSFHRYQEEGSYDVVLRVTDGLLYAETRTTIAVVELDEPSLTYPSNGSEVSGLLTLRGSIREVTGFDVDQVDVKVGSRDWDKAEGTSSWTYDINTARYPDGELKIKVRYTVDNSIESTTEITVQVSNNSGSGNGILVPVIVIIALLLLLVVIYFVFLRRKPRSFEEYLPPPPGRGPVPPRGLPPSAPKASLPAPGGTPQPPKKDEPPQTQPPGIEDDRPRSFRIKCPSCGKLFRSLDSGERPLHITCKHCGANGVVESIPGDEESEGTEEEEPAEDEPDPVPIVCPSCGGLFELDEMSETAKCPYCGVEGELDEDTLSMLKERFSEEDEELTLKCPTCMGTFKVKGEKGPIICPYCGSKGKAAS
ncbi:MAG: PKD domain-containing protein, partial [Candidatus Thermoplasmatota archaeon]|nr:PKD domain-containing protein [Candidatus Thermoplasmatota archaeon]